METDPVNVSSQSVGIRPDHLDRLLAVGFVDPNGTVCSQSMGMEKEHDIAYHLLFSPGLLDTLAPLCADTLHLLETLRLVLDDVEDLLPELFHELRGIDGADSLDHSAPEVFLDSFQRGWRLGLEMMSLQLDTMVAVFLPGSLGGDPFAGSHRGEGTENGHRFLAPLDLDLKDAEAGLFVVEGHAFHLTAQGIVRTAGDRFIVRLLPEGAAAVHRIFLKGWGFGGFWQRR